MWLRCAYWVCVLLGGEDTRRKFQSIQLYHSGHQLVLCCNNYWGQLDKWGQQKNINWAIMVKLFPLKVNMHHKHDIALKCPNYIPVHYKIFHLWKFMPESMRESKRAELRVQRADHRRWKSWAKSRPIYGRNTLKYSKFSKLISFMMNWNIFVSI